MKFENVTKSKFSSIVNVATGQATQQDCAAAAATIARPLILDLIKAVDARVAGSELGAEIVQKEDGWYSVTDGAQKEDGWYSVTEGTSIDTWDKLKAKSLKIALDPEAPTNKLIKAYIRLESFSADWQIADQDVQFEYWVEQSIAPAAGLDGEGTRMLVLFMLKIIDAANGEAVEFETAEQWNQLVAEGSL